MNINAIHGEKFFAIINFGENAVKQHIRLGFHKKNIGCAYIF
jgi:hypothetical protein